MVGRQGLEPWPAFLHVRSALGHSRLLARPPGGSDHSWCTATAARSARVETPSFLKMLVKWVVTVRRDMNRAATWGLVGPSATAATTLSSVRDAMIARADEDRNDGLLRLRRCVFPGRRRIVSGHERRRRSIPPPNLRSSTPVNPPGIPGQDFCGGDSRTIREPPSTSPGTRQFKISQPLSRRDDGRARSARWAACAGWSVTARQRRGARCQAGLGSGPDVSPPARWLRARQT